MDFDVQKTREEDTGEMNQRREADESTLADSKKQLGEGSIPPPVNAPMRKEKLDRLLSVPIPVVGARDVRFRVSGQGKSGG
eukprot:2971245-Alexandrium_andersonii.AAC.1